MADQPKSSMARVQAAADAAGLSIEIKTMAESTRTAAEAAAAVDCAVGQIVKSLVFERADSGEIVLLLIAGDRQADLDAAAEVCGGPLSRPNGRRVRDATGFAIGGVAPIGHTAQPRVFMDPSLLDHAVVWAAAGAPDAVFAVDPKALQAATKAALLPPIAAG